MRQFFTSIAMLLFSLFVKAQTTSPAYEFFINPYALSPSNSGLNGNHEVFVGGFYHMAGVAGSPVGVNANYNGIIKGNSGLGLKLDFEKYGAFRNINFDLSYAYHLKIASVHRLSIGLALQLHQNSLDFANSNSDPLNDPTIASQNLKSGVAFNAGFGITYTFSRLIASVSMQNIVPLKRDNKLTLFTQPQTLRVYLSYDFLIGRKLSIRPAVLVDQTFNASINYNAIISVKYINRIWLNLGYAAQNLISVGVGALITERLSVQYTFKYALGGIIKTTAGDHEICLGVAFGKLNNRSSANSIFSKLSKSPYHEWE